MIRTTDSDSSPQFFPVMHRRPRETKKEEGVKRQISIAEA
jgi:hypothetical protein